MHVWSLEGARRAWLRSFLAREATVRTAMALRAVDPCIGRNASTDFLAGDLGVVRLHSPDARRAMILREVQGNSVAVHQTPATATLGDVWAPSASAAV
jgi:hypothetical protein